MSTCNLLRPGNFCGDHGTKFVSRGRSRYNLTKCCLFREKSNFRSLMDPFATDGRGRHHGSKVLLAQSLSLRKLAGRPHLLLPFHNYHLPSSPHHHRCSKKVARRARFSDQTYFETVKWIRIFFRSLCFQKNLTLE